MLEVKIHSAHETLYEGRVTCCIFPGEQGVFEVRSFHQPILSRLLTGQILIDGQPISIHRGIVKVEFDRVTALVERA